jgi:hypothetical protein
MALDILEGVETLITGLTWDGQQVYQVEKEMTAVSAPFSTRSIAPFFTNLDRAKTKINTSPKQVTDYNIILNYTTLKFPRVFRSLQVVLQYSINGGADGSGTFAINNDGQSSILNGLVDGDVVDIIDTGVSLIKFVDNTTQVIPAFSFTINSLEIQTFTTISLERGDLNKDLDIILDENGIVTNLEPVPPYRIVVQYTKA